MRAVILASAVAMATAATCQLRTQTHTDWLDDTRCRNRNPDSLACYVERNFDAAFPDGLIVGKDKSGKKFVKLQSVADLRKVVRDGSKGPLPDACDDGDVDCLSGGLSNNLVTKAVALSLNAGFDACSRTGACESFCAECNTAGPGLLEARVTEPTSYCFGLTVEQVLKKANCILSGGGRCGLGVKRAVKCLSDVNKNFADGTANENQVLCEGDELPESVPTPSPVTVGSQTTPPPVPRNMCDQKVEVMFIADGSNSVGRGEWENLIDFIVMLAPSFAPVGTNDGRLGLISYSDIISHFIDFDDAEGKDLELFQLFLLNDITRRRKSTATGDALIKAWKNWKKRPKAAGVQRILILVTDGEPTSEKKCETNGFSGNPYDCAREVLPLLQDEEDVVVVFIQTGGKTTALFEGAEDYYFPIRYSDLDGIRDTLVSDVCDLGGPPVGSQSFCELRTHDQAAWLDGGASVATAGLCDLDDPQCFLISNFDTAFPSGLTVGSTGSGTKIVFSLGDLSSLPPAGAGDVPTVLPLSCSGNLNCLNGLPANPLLAETLALALNLGFDACSRAGNCDKFCPRCVNTPGLQVAVVPTGPCQGSTAQDVLNLANCVLRGGQCSSTPEDVMDCVQRINVDFADRDNNPAGLGGLTTLDVNCDTQAPTASPSVSPTNSPSATPSATPTQSPSASPSVSPSKAPTKGPTKAPSEAPTKGPTEAPTKGPTEAPTKAPTEAPTKAPTEAPTKAPTEAPTKAPTEAPTKAPTEAPTKAPTEAPTKAPTEAPTKAPTEAPTKAPTEAPTKAPTEAPTKSPITCAQAEVDMVMVVDRSSSISNTNFNLIRNLVGAIADEFTLPTNTGDSADGKSRFGLITFGTGRTIKNMLSDNTDQADFQALAAQNRPGGTQYTNTWAGLSAAFDQVNTVPRLRVDGGDVQRYVLVFSDGTPTTDQSSHFNNGCKTDQGVGTDDPTGGYTSTSDGSSGDPRRFHCTKYWAEEIADLDDVTVIYIQLPFGGGAGNPAEPDEMEKLLLRNAPPFDSNDIAWDTGINPAGNYARILAEDYQASLDAVLGQVQEEVCT